ncbi:hypothetical protein Cgig2_010643 [Carnegiea gigantea]|uniref:Uncharacterized protein n=1 Tax=Carnegiea gigantea TaxID=171969 RepID=A0A9Q1JRS7_9CARY|nr:hypothetical protein Cgig2_010643 [Carnegiea gigantea]
MTLLLQSSDKLKESLIMELFRVPNSMVATKDEDLFRFPSSMVVTKRQGLHSLQEVNWIAEINDREETTEDGKELFFDHGAPYFTVTNPDVLGMVLEWESRGLVAEWEERFGTFDFTSKTFINSEKESARRKYVGIPGMNSICKALCNETGVDCKFGVGIAKMEWVDEKSWSLSSVKGQFLGSFDGVVATDKILASSGFFYLTEHPPPLGMITYPVLSLDLYLLSSVPKLLELKRSYSFPTGGTVIGYEVSEMGTGLSAQLVETLTLRDVDIGQNSHRVWKTVDLYPMSDRGVLRLTCVQRSKMESLGIIDITVAPQLASRMREIPSRSCFALMMAFNEPLNSVPVKGFSFINSEVLSSAFCDSSKPSRSSASQCWVLHSTAEYAKTVIAQSDSGLKKPSDSTLRRVSEELLQEFQRTGLCTSQPFFLKAHRWSVSKSNLSIHFMSLL